MKREYLKWIGFSVIITSLSNIFIYDVYTRLGFIFTQTMLFLYGYLLVVIYFMINNNKNNEDTNK